VFGHHRYHHLLHSRALPAVLDSYVIAVQPRYNAPQSKPLRQHYTRDLLCVAHLLEVKFTRNIVIHQLYQEDGTAISDVLTTSRR
jgi:hypothetical protein